MAWQPARVSRFRDLAFHLSHTDPGTTRPALELAVGCGASGLSPPAPRPWPGNEWTLALWAGVDCCVGCRFGPERWGQWTLCGPLRSATDECVLAVGARCWSACVVRMIDSVYLQSTNNLVVANRRR